MMKYIITENQYKLFIESKIPISVRRRAFIENLEKFILDSEIQNPPECSHYDDGYDYADAVIDDAIDDFLTKISPDLEEIDEYSDILDYLRKLFRDSFGQSLVYMFEDNCAEAKFDADPTLNESQERLRRRIARIEEVIPTVIDSVASVGTLSMLGFENFLNMVASMTARKVAEESSSNSESDDYITFRNQMQHYISRNYRDQIKSIFSDLIS
jgi:hypothetical protein